VGRIGQGICGGLRTRDNDVKAGRRRTQPGDQRESEMASDKLRTLTDSNFDQEIKDGVVLVDFWAEWCGPCRRIAPIVEELAGQYDGRATVGKLNVDENPNVPGRFMIRGIPTLLLFKNGQLADTLVGLAPKEDIARMIDRHLQG
jgi:thioredoxin 1